MVIKFVSEIKKDGKLIFRIGDYAEVTHTSAQHQMGYYVENAGNEIFIAAEDVEEEAGLRFFNQPVSNHS